MIKQNCISTPSRLFLLAAPIGLAALSLSASAAGADRRSDPLRFFEGRTESVSTVKVITRKPYRSRTLGRGQIGSDGALTLVQRVEEEGKAPFDRRWRIRQVAPGRYTGTMNEAKGPVTVEEVDGRYRFRFMMKGNLAIEQWLSPVPDGRSAKSNLTIRKMGVTVGRSEGTVRKLS